MMIRSAALLALATVAVFVVGPSGALAQRQGSNAPIDVAADSIELQDRANRAVLAGNVAIKQAEMLLNAPRVNVAYVGRVTNGSPQASRFDASGGVTVRRPGQTARSQYAIYDVNRRVITMLGNVSLTQAGNTVNGGRLTINLNTDRAVIDGANAGGPTRGADGTMIQNQGGRVTGRFSVPDRN